MSSRTMFFRLNEFQRLTVLLKVRTQGDIALAASFFSLFEQAEYFRLNLLND